MDVFANVSRPSQPPLGLRAAAAFPVESHHKNTFSPVLFVVEDPHDIRFLRRISRIAHADSPELPDLRAPEQKGRLMFLRVGGNGPVQWADQLCRLGAGQVHLYDREMSPKTEVREQGVRRLRPLWQSSSTASSDGSKG